MTATITASMTDDEFVTAFENQSLGNEAFHHADHVRMGFLYVCRYPAPEALRRFSEALKKFAAAKGKPGLYHETITWAFLFLIRERLARFEQRGERPVWAEFASQNQDLLNWKENVLKTYYRDETLKSDLARAIFVMPDRSVP